MEFSSNKKELMYRGLYNSIQTMNTNCISIHAHAHYGIFNFSSYFGQRMLFITLLVWDLMATMKVEMYYGINTQAVIS